MGQIQKNLGAKTEDQNINIQNVRLQSFAYSCIFLIH